MAAAAAAAAAAADHILKSGDVSAMIRQGFLSSPTSPAARISPAASPPPASHSLSSSTTPPPPLPLPPPTTTTAAATTTTLFDMIAEEERYRHLQTPALRALPAPSGSQKRTRLQERVAAILAGGKYPDGGAGDVELTVSSGDGFRVSMTVHRSVLAAHSRFFAEKLAGAPAGAAHAVEICDCDDAEVYVEAVALMYCHQPRRKLTGETISKILALLKVRRERERETD